jgi:hypothetical protein
MLPRLLQITIAVRRQLESAISDNSGNQNRVENGLVAEFDRRRTKVRTWYHPHQSVYARVPPDFEFPKTLSLKPCWNLYLHGNPAAEICPFGLLDTKDIWESNDRFRLSSMKTVCKFILDLMSDQEIATVDVNNSAEPETDALFVKLWSRASVILSEDNLRRDKLRGDLCITTVYNEILAYRRRTIVTVFKCRGKI